MNMEVIKPITPDELTKNNRFVKWYKEKPANPNVSGYIVRGKRAPRPTREEAKRMQLRTLGLFVGVDGLRICTPQRCAQAANNWIHKGKKAILDTFFPTEKDTSLNAMF